MIPSFDCPFVLGANSIAGMMRDKCTRASGPRQSGVSAFLFHIVGTFQGPHPGAPGSSRESCSYGAPEGPKAKYVTCVRGPFQ